MVMTQIDKYDHAWLTSRGCPVDVPLEPTSFEVEPTDFTPQILVGPKDSVVWLWLRIKSLRRQTIEAIGLTLPWVKLLFGETLTSLRTAYPCLYLVPDVGEYELDQFLNPYISRKLSEGQECDGCLVAISVDEVPWTFAHGIEVKALICFQLSDGRKSSHEVEVIVNRKWRNQMDRAQDVLAVPALMPQVREDHEESRIDFGDARLSRENDKARDGRGLLS